MIHSLGLKTDGSLVAWGDNYSRPVQRARRQTRASWPWPAGLYHSLGLRADGSIVGVDDGNLPDDHGQISVPAPNADFVAVAAGGYHSLGLKSDGSIKVWGWNNYGQRTVPEPNATSRQWRAASITAWA